MSSPFFAQQVPETRRPRLGRHSGSPGKENALKRAGAVRLNEEQAQTATEAGSLGHIRRSSLTNFSRHVRAQIERLDPPRVDTSIPRSPPLTPTVSMRPERPKRPMSGRFGVQKNVSRTSRDSSNLPTPRATSFQEGTFVAYSPGAHSPSMAVGLLGDQRMRQGTNQKARAWRLSPPTNKRGITVQRDPADPTAPTNEEVAPSPTTIAPIPQYGPRTPFIVDQSRGPSIDFGDFGKRAFSSFSIPPRSGRTELFIDVQSPSHSRSQTPRPRKGSAQFVTSSGAILTMTEPEDTPWQRNVFLHGPIRLGRKPSVVDEKAVASMEPFQDALESLDGAETPRRTSDDAAIDGIVTFFEELDIFPISASRQGSLVRISQMQPAPSSPLPPVPPPRSALPIPPALAARIST